MSSKWQGFHHVAVVTADLEATLRFYGEVLGMGVGEIMGQDARGVRHCFVRPDEAAGMELRERNGVEMTPVGEADPELPLSG